MSLILKGIDLPKNCIECPLEGGDVDDDGFDYWYCKITESMANTLERPSNCPLIQIPKGHGRLIDADALYKFFEDALNKNPLDDWWEAGAVLDNIEIAPTILESEGKDEHTD